MTPTRRMKLIGILENVLRVGVLFALSLTIVLMGIGVFDNGSNEEAYTGSFKSYTFNSGWRLRGDSSGTKYTLPISIDPDMGDQVTIVNTLPGNLGDGMSIMLKTTVSDVRIYIDGQLRSDYSTDSSGYISYYIPSAYVVAGLNAMDSGKEISITFTFKTKRIINEISLGYGNNVWFNVIQKAILVNFITFVLLLLGLILYFASLFIRKSFRVNATRYLGLLTIVVSLWIISESTLRQIYFSRASLCQYFVYFLVELIPIAACMYFDEVQHRVYHERYITLECLAFLQILVNIVLHYCGIVELYNTMMVSHAWAGLCAFIASVNIATDIRKNRINGYRFSVMGMISFMVMAFAEMFSFLLNRFHVFGTEICLGLLFLMTATIIQTVYDEVYDYKTREKNYTEMTLNTLETIASAIDARDEYTGGHSERVGLYAERLAREMAADYDLSEEDILKVHYIGLVHDIGKIGVADSVLNKSGKLTEEEFSLMKKHTEIGYEVMASLGDGIDGLLDGIRHHHERFDGTGYPDGLSDTDIPLVARILALADSYDAMTSNRVYRFRLTNEQARNEIERCAGTQFDPALATIFVRLIDKNQITPCTIEGSAVDINGVVRNSALLEKHLLKDLFDKEEIVNPSHVRMLCYVMKLMEKKGKDYQVVFVDIPEGSKELIAAIKHNTDSHDINILYKGNQHVIALYDKTYEELREFIETIKRACPDVRLNPLV